MFVVLIFHQKPNRTVSVSSATQGTSLDLVELHWAMGVAEHEKVQHWTLVLLVLLVLVHHWLVLVLLVLVHWQLVQLVLVHWQLVLVHWQLVQLLQLLLMVLVHWQLVQLVLLVLVHWHLVQLMAGLSLALFQAAQVVLIWILLVPALVATTCSGGHPLVVVLVEKGAHQIHHQGQRTGCHRRLDHLALPAHHMKLNQIPFFCHVTTVSWHWAICLMKANSTRKLI